MEIAMEIIYIAFATAMVFLTFLALAICLVAIVMWFDELGDRLYRRTRYQTLWQKRKPRK